MAECSIFVSLGIKVFGIAHRQTLLRLLRLVVFFGFTVSFSNYFTGKIQAYQW